jgi:hypothetical protein
MATALLSPSAKQQFFLNDGTPAAAGKLYTYAANTTTPQATFTNRAGTVANANPIILDARGEATVYLTPGVMYDYVLTTSGDVTVWTREDVSADAGDADAVSFLQSGTGAIPQDIQTKLRRNLLDVMDYGAAGNGTTDDTAAFTKAVTECQARGGGTVLVPRGTFLVTGFTIPDGPSVLLRGEGADSVIKTNTTSGDIVTVVPWYSGLANLKVSGNPSRTAGSNINLTGVGNFAYKCYIEGDRNGIRMSGVACKIVECEFFYAAAGSDRIYATGGDTSQLIQNCIMYANPGIHAGIYVDNSAALKIYDNDVVGQGISLLISPGNGQHVFSLWSRGNFYDSATAGVLVNPSGTGQVTRLAITDDWASSHSQNGIQLIASGSALIDGVDIDGCECHLNGGNGVGLTGTQVQNVRIRRLVARSNGAGLSLDGAANTTVEGLQFGAYANLGANTTGIFIAGGATYRITGGDIRGQTVVGYTAGDTSRVIYDLWGFEQPRALVGTAIPFLNGWQNFVVSGYDVAKYYKDHGGRVYVSGLIKLGTIGLPAFQLPVGFRPADKLAIGTASNSAFGQLEIDSNGNVTPTVGSNASVSVCFDFLAAGSP